MHEGKGGTYLWVTNPTRTSRKVSIRLDTRNEDWKAKRDLWDGKPIRTEGSTIHVTVDERNAAVIPLL
jgi:hypothetical protein